MIERLCRVLGMGWLLNPACMPFKILIVVKRLVMQKLLPQLTVSATV